MYYVTWGPTYTTIIQTLYTFVFLVFLLFFPTFRYYIVGRVLLLSLALYVLSYRNII